MINLLKSINEIDLFVGLVTRALQEFSSTLMTAELRNI